MPWVLFYSHSNGKFPGVNPLIFVTVSEIPTEIEMVPITMMHQITPPPPPAPKPFDLLEIVDEIDPLSDDLDIIDADYNHEAWRCTVQGLEGEPERGGRCLQCFKMRLLDTARYAHENGFSVITTTLASSRWKSLEQINQAGRYAVENYPDVIWWDQNWRKGGLSERRIAIIKEYGFYNQQYCGCEFSMRKEESPSL